MKRLFTVIVMLLLSLSFCVPALAESDQGYNKTAQADSVSVGYIIDSADILTSEEWVQLETKSQKISELYDCGVYIITTDDYTEYSYAGSIYEAAKEIYNEYGLGWGNEKSGVLLMLSLDERDYALIACGYGNTAFTDYGKDMLADTFLDDFADNMWYSGFADYLDTSADMLKMAEAGTPLDVGSRSTDHTASVLFSIILGCLLSLIVCLALRRRMKSVHKKAEAEAYISPGSVNFTAREDIYTHTTEVRTKIQKDSGSGGTSVDSSGFSGKSGKF